MARHTGSSARGERYVERDVVYRDRRGPLRRLVGGITSFIGWTVLLVILAIVLLVILL